MRLRVHCEDWVLGDRGYGVAVGDAFSEVLVLHGVEGSWPLELVTNRTVGVTPLPRWEGLSFGHDAYRLEIGPVTA
ncbi:hypothetical protein [Serinicoccus chungangensis]|uniref:hypothetical protein n=1 Tax=Serinicoccus chungangensis TaxID=767452 RepID=UPI001117F332|nr:hypothetical protein [Serinicoccus chungangensis]